MVSLVEELLVDYQVEMIMDNNKGSFFTMSFLFHLFLHWLIFYYRCDYSASKLLEIVDLTTSNLDLTSINLLEVKLKVDSLEETIGKTFVSFALLLLDLTRFDYYSFQQGNQGDSYSGE